MSELEDPNIERVRWPGSGSFPVGLTPFGIYDNDDVYIRDIQQSSKWAATRLGYPVLDVELIDIQFYACFEEAVNEYSAQVNQFNIRYNISSLQGQPINRDFTQQNIQSAGLQQQIRLSQAYGTEVGVGGNVDWKRGCVSIKCNQQLYDLQCLWGNVHEAGERIEIKRIFHHRPAAIARVYDPFSMTGMSYSNVLNELGFGGYSPATQFLMAPIFEDLLRTQAIEFNDEVRKSHYSFELVNNKLRIFPIPTHDFTLYFDYLVVKDRDASLTYPVPVSDNKNCITSWTAGKCGCITSSLHCTCSNNTASCTCSSGSGSNCTCSNDTSSACSCSCDTGSTSSNDTGSMNTGSNAAFMGSSYTNSTVIGDYSNVPYSNIPYSSINSVGKQWIKKYFLALCKELLGAIRAKYSTVPIPGGDVSLDGSELRSEASSEKDALITQLRENLEETSPVKQAENMTARINALQEGLQKVPLYIYVG
jgi:hypothetical protein